VIQGSHGGDLVRGGLLAPSFIQNSRTVEIVLTERV
jgi:hypothetical protein